METTQDLVYGLAASPSPLAPLRKGEGSGARDIFAAKQSGLYRSSNNGKTWTNAYAALKLSAPLATTCVTLAPVKKITYIFAGVEGNVLRSLDAGKTWAVAALETPAPLITALAVSPDFAHDSTVLAATMQDGVFHSTDRGATWTRFNFGLYDPNVNALAFIDAQTVLCGTQSGVFISANGGRAWRDLAFPVDAAPVQALAFSRAKTIYAGTEAEGLYVSQDEGKSWKKRRKGPVEQIHIHNERIFILSNRKLLHSDDGRTWHAHAKLKTDAAISAFIANPLMVGLSNGDMVTP